MIITRAHTAGRNVLDMYVTVMFLLNHSNAITYRFFYRKAVPKIADPISKTGEPQDTSF